tara:strand:- start:106 stop:264 length:159 start_codon:yes stop_codon:yes gene_type:complete
LYFQAIQAKRKRQLRFTFLSLPNSGITGENNLTIAGDRRGAMTVVKEGFSGF